MPTKKDHPYECPRCGYHTTYAHLIRNHMSRKKICIAVKNDIELTDNIKHIVMANRRFNPSLQTVAPEVTQCNAKNQFFHAFVDALAIDQLILGFQRCRPVKVENVDDMIKRSLKNGDWWDKLDSSSNKVVPSPVIAMEDYVDWIHDLTSVQRLTEGKELIISGIYCNVANNMGYFDNYVFIEYTNEHNLLKSLLVRAQTLYLNRYELHLMERATINEDVSQVGLRAQNLLRDYYMVLQMFDLESPTSPWSISWTQAEEATVEKEMFYSRLANLVRKNIRTNARYVVAQIKTLFYPSTII